MSLSRRLGVGFIGTFWLVLGGCGTAVLAATVPHTGVGFVGVALAFGLTLLTMAYAIGHISGCHINPAVTVGLCAGGRFPAGEVIPYIVAQVLGAVFASTVLYVIASGAAGFSLSAGFAANGYGDHSPGGYPLLSCAVSEVVMTLMFLFVIMGATDPRPIPSGLVVRTVPGGEERRVPPGFAPIPVGLVLTLIHLISIPVTNTSVNPARSTGPALFVGGWALAQLWLFWVAPIVGGALGGILYRSIFESSEE